jgi:hypothetical protein
LSNNDYTEFFHFWTVNEPRKANKSEPSAKFPEYTPPKVAFVSAFPPQMCFLYHIATASSGFLLDNKRGGIFAAS